MSGEDSAGPSWVIGVVEPNRDFDVDCRLRRAGYRVVFLTYRHLLTGHNRAGWRTATDFVPRPLFPGYLFMRLWPNEAWPQHIPGYAGLLENGRRAVPETKLLDWRNRVDLGEFDDRPPVAITRSGKFVPATDPEERRQLLREHFAAVLQKAETIYA